MRAPPRTAVRTASIPAGMCRHGGRRTSPLASQARLSPGSPATQPLSTTTPRPDAPGGGVRSEPTGRPRALPDALPCVLRTWKPGCAWSGARSRVRWCALFRFLCSRSIPAYGGANFPSDSGRSPRFVWRGQTRSDARHCQAGEGRFSVPTFVCAGGKGCISLCYWFCTRSQKAV